MTKALHKALITVLVAATAGSVAAQEPRQAARELEFLLGDWEVTASEFREGNWVDGQATRSRIGERYDGLMVHDSTVFAAPSDTLEMITVIGPHNEDEYRLIAMGGDGSLDLYQGGFRGGSLVFTNLETGEPWVASTGERYFFRLTFEVSRSRQRSFLVEFTLDDGATWTPYHRASFVRLAD